MIKNRSLVKSNDRFFSILLFSVRFNRYNDDYFELELRHLLQFSFVVAFVILILFFICSL